MALNNESFPLNKDSYLVFDSLSLKSLIKQRLTDENIVTDQAYEGSYLSTLIDIVAFTFNTLIYYANRTYSEGNFCELTYCPFWIRVWISWATASNFTFVEYFPLIFSPHFT